MKKYFGDKAFYKMVLHVALPIIIQNGITNFVGLLDNIMVGRIGTEQLSGIAIVNQLMLVFNLAIFGAISGAGIFSAQFYGCGDHKGVQRTFRFKIYVCAAICLIGIGVFIGAGEELIAKYLQGQSGTFDAAATMNYGYQYLMVMLFGLIPFALEEIYAGTLRECGQTRVPMVAGTIAVFVNLGLNYLLIFGKLGMPQLGVVGAAVATVISRIIQLLIVMMWTHRNAQQVPFIIGAYREFTIPMHLTVQIIKKGTPLMVNEILWAAGIATMNQCYSTRGIDAVAATSIASTISNLFNVVFMAMGIAISIIVGQLLGAGKMEEARDTDTKLIVFSLCSCLVMGTILFAMAPLFPKLYKTTDTVRTIARNLLMVQACCMPIWAFLHASYFTLRTGGKTIITFLFDSVFLWVVSIPVGYMLSRGTQLTIVYLYLFCQLLDLIKCVIGYVLVKKGVWINNIVANDRA